MRSIGIGTMVLVLAAFASAGSPIQPSKQSQSAASNWVARSKESIPKAEPAGSTDNETLSAEAKPGSDVAETISATETEQSTPAPEASSISNDEPKPLAQATTGTPAAKGADPGPITESSESASSMMIEEMSDEVVVDPRRSNGLAWMSGSPAEADPYYGRLEYLYWKTSNPSPSGRVFQSFSVAQFTQQRTLIDTINLNDVHTDYEMGIRALIGRNLTQDFGIELGGLWVYPGTDLKALFSQPASTSQTGGVTQEVITVLTPTGQTLGQANMSYRNRYWGTELNGRWHLINNRHWTFDGLVGARYFDYAERLAFGYNLSNPSTQAGARVERFETNNHMIGGQFGSDIQMALLEYVSLQSVNRVAILGNAQNVTVKSRPLPGMGEFTSFSNLGAHNTGAGSVLLETTPSVVVHLTPDITFQAGYTIIWMNNIMRSAEQLDLNQVGRSPLISFKMDDMFITGFSFALTANW